MKKFLLFLLLLIVLLLAGTYTVLFTPMGNNLVAGVIEQKANETKTANFKVEKFVLTTSNIDFKATVDNNSSIDVTGEFALLDMNIDLNYNANVKDLSKLKTLIGTELKGSFNTKGSVKGNKQRMDVEGKSNVFDSRTQYEATLVNLEPIDINFMVQDAQISRILTMIKQPNYASGKISIDGKLTNMQGQIITTVLDGRVNNAVVNKAFDQKLVQSLNFKANVKTKVSQKEAISTLSAYTTMANVFVKKAVFDLKTHAINSDYEVKVDDLSKLYDVAQMKLRGNLALTGEVVKHKKLLVKGNSDIFDGKMKFELLNDDFTATVKNIELLNALHTMYYPEIFTSRGNIALNYNLKEKKGQVSGDLAKGQFLPNKYSLLLKNLAKFDITKEVYEDTRFKSNINKDIIKSTLNMKSKYTQIKVTKSTLNSKLRTVDAMIDTIIKDVVLKTKVTGSLDKPKISIDTSELVKSKLKKKLKKEKDRFLRKLFK